jgi:hypothetical protein
VTAVVERELDDDADELARVDLATHRQLTQAWAAPRGVIGWLSDTDHKAIGLRYVVTAFGSFGLAG